MVSDTGKDIWRIIAFSLLIATLPVMAFATVVEKIKGAASAAALIYDTPGFIILWCLLGVSATIYLLRRRRSLSAAALGVHFSFLLILAGAGVSWATSVHGTVTVPVGGGVYSFKDDTGAERGFSNEVTLKDFRIETYPGSPSPMNFHATIESAGRERPVSLNHTAEAGGYRFCLKSFTTDPRQVTFSVSRDVIGTGITYAGYLLLLITFIWLLIAPGGHFRRICRHIAATAAIAAAILIPSSSAEASIVTRNDARAMRGLLVENDGRIMPLDVMAGSIVSQIHGSDSHEGMDATAILTDIYLNSPEWGERPFIKVKDKEVRKLLGITRNYASYNDFISDDGEYKLYEPIRRADESDAASANALRRADESFQMMKLAMEGEIFRIFPVRTDGVLKWYSPVGKLPRELDPDHYAFIRNSFNLLTEYLVTGRHDDFASAVDKIASYQRKTAKDGEIPSEGEITAERHVSGSPLPLGLVILIAGFAGFLPTAFASRMSRKTVRVINIAEWCVIGMGTLMLAAGFMLRWYAGHHIPLGNGPETMRFLALAIGIQVLAAGRKMHISPAIGAMAMGLSLMVAAMGHDGGVSLLMPVLNSPLLSIHVAIIMGAYALLLILALQSAAALISGNASLISRTALIARAMLYPAVALMAIGIFTGAVWANESWGRYWGWDPKETWALITMIIYALPLHPRSLPLFGKERALLIYCTAASVSIAITYFGVNFLLGGLHSYA